MVLIFTCETASPDATGRVVTYGECLAGPIRVGDAVERIVRDVDSERRVALTVLAVRPAGGAGAELAASSWGALTIAGPGAGTVAPGDLLVTVPPR